MVGILLRNGNTTKQRNNGIALHNSATRGETTAYIAYNITFINKQVGHSF